MEHFETIAEVLDEQHGSNLLTVAATYSTVELIEGEIVSFYSNFPRKNETEAEGKLVVVTTKCIVETTIRFPKDWEFYNSSANLDAIDINSRRVSIESIIGINVKSTPRYWNPDIQQRRLSNVEVSVKTLTGEEIVVVYPNQYHNDNRMQSLSEILKVLKL